MKILAVNGSPRGAAGNTETLLQSFLAGAREAGAETEVVYLKDKRIEHCLGCFTCWFKTPGVCVHRDDMPALLEKLETADLAVLATPLYIYTFSGLMKDFLDRVIPGAQPFILREGGVSYHPPRHRGLPRLLLISNCGFPEQDHFAGIKESMRLFTRSHSGLAGTICCAAGELFRQEDLAPHVAWYLEACRSAGREVATAGSIAPATQATLDRPLVEDPDLFAATANAYMESQLGVVLGAPLPEEGHSPHGTPLPPPTGREAMRDLVSGMALVFKAEAAGDLRAMIQFAVTGDEAGEYFLDIAAGRCRAYEGRHPKPTLTIKTPARVWREISAGRLNGATAFMTGKYKIQGQMGLLMQMNKLFGRSEQA